MLNLNQPLSRDEILTLFEKAILEKTILTGGERTIDDLLDKYDDELDDEDLEWLAHFSRRYNPELAYMFEIALEKRDEYLLEEYPDRYCEKYPERCEIVEGGSPHPAAGE